MRREDVSGRCLLGDSDCHPSNLEIVEGVPLSNELLLISRFGFNTPAVALRCELGHDLFWAIASGFNPTPSRFPPTLASELERLTLAPFRTLIVGAKLIRHSASQKVTPRKAP